MGTVRIRIALLACLLTLTGASHALAQITAATISGTVNDESAGVLPGVTIEVKNHDTGLTRSMTTDGNGFFTIPGLPPGPATRSKPRSPALPAPSRAASCSPSASRPR